MSNSIGRVYLTVNGLTYALGPRDNLDDLRSQVLRATHAGVGFLSVTVDGGQLLSFYVTSTTSIAIAVDTEELNTDTADGVDQKCASDTVGEYWGGEAPYDAI